MYTPEQEELHLRLMAKAFFRSLIKDEMDVVCIDTYRPFGSTNVGPQLLNILGIIPEGLVATDLGYDEFYHELEKKRKECYKYVLGLYDDKFLPYLQQIGECL